MNVQSKALRLVSTEPDVEREVMSGPLSRRNSFRLRIKGHFGVREIDKLISLLRVQKEVLEDDEDQAGRFVTDDFGNLVQVMP